MSRTDAKGYFARRSPKITPAGIKALARTTRAIWHHPLGGRSGIIRFVRWQVGTRVLGSVRVEVPWIDGTRLLLERGMQGATGNLYCQLLEYADMSFVLDVLRPGDLFVDVGANVGVYTILASGARDAHTIALEPGSVAYERLQRHVILNGIQERVTALQMGASRDSGTLHLTSDYDTVNRVVDNPGQLENTEEMVVDALDRILESEDPSLIKIDVEGWECEVLSGAARVLDSESLLAVIVEVNNSGLRYGYSQEDIFSLLCDHGFSPYTYLPQPKQLVSGVDANSNNVIFIRDEKAVRQRLITHH